MKVKREKLFISPMNDITCAAENYSWLRQRKTAKHPILNGVAQETTRGVSTAVEEALPSSWGKNFLEEMTGKQDLTLDVSEKWLGSQYSWARDKDFNQISNILTNFNIVIYGDKCATESNTLPNG